MPANLKDLRRSKCSQLAYPVELLVYLRHKYLTHDYVSAGLVYDTSTLLMITLARD